MAEERYPDDAAAFVNAVIEVQVEPLLVDKNANPVVVYNDVANIYCPFPDMATEPHTLVPRVVVIAAKVVPELLDKYTDPLVTQVKMY
jgi:hypothetical protein